MYSKFLDLGSWTCLPQESTVKAPCQTLRKKHTKATFQRNREQLSFLERLIRACDDHFSRLHKKCVQCWQHEGDKDMKTEGHLCKKSPIHRHVAASCGAAQTPAPTCSLGPITTLSALVTVHGDEVPGLPGTTQKEAHVTRQKYYSQGPQWAPPAHTDVLKQQAQMATAWSYESSTLTWDSDLVLLWSPFLWAPTAHSKGVTGSISTQHLYTQEAVLWLPSLCQVAWGEAGRLGKVDLPPSVSVPQRPHGHLRQGLHSHWQPGQCLRHHRGSAGQQHQHSSGPGRPPQCYENAGWWPDPLRENGTAGALPNPTQSWLSTQPNGAGSTKDGTSAEPGKHMFPRVCSTLTGAPVLHKRLSFFQQSSIYIPLGGFSSQITRIQNCFKRILYNYTEFTSQWTRS